MRFGYWLPVFGGWLRNVPDEGMDASWQYSSRLARRSEELGFDLTLIAELNLNDIKGEDAPTLDAWSTAAALAAVTEELEIMVAVRPAFHEPALLAKQAANIDRISGGRLSLNVVSAWWASEARRYGVPFDRHDRRYDRTREWVEVVTRMWSDERTTFEGEFYRVADAVLQPKPVRHPRPTLWAGGESPAGKTVIAEACDGWLTHGDPVHVLGPKIEGMRRRRAELGLPAMRYGAAGFVVVRDSEWEAREEVERITDVRASAAGYDSFRDWVGNTDLERTLSVQDYSVSNRGLRTDLVGTPEQVADRIRRLEAVGLDLLLLQFSPQLEEMERFAEQVLPLVRS